LVELAEITAACFCQFCYFLRYLLCCVFKRVVVTIGDISHSETIADSLKIYLYHTISVNDLTSIWRVQR
jgi:hypothetical protein